MRCALPTPDAQRILAGMTQDAIGNDLNSLRTKPALRNPFCPRDIMPPRTFEMQRNQAPSLAQPDTGIPARFHPCFDSQ
jgi:hypothetical protein